MRFYAPILGVLSLSLNSCGAYDLGKNDAPHVTVDTANPTWANGVQAVIEAKCANCHAKAAERNSFVPANTPKLVDNIKLQSFFEGASSYAAGYPYLVYRRVFETPDDPMPPTFGTPLYDDELAALKGYLTNLNFSKQCVGITTTALTYADVKPIIDSKCVSCHLATSSVRKPLATLAQIRVERDAAIAYVTAGTMPDGAPEFGPSEEGKNLLNWLCAGSDLTSTALHRN